MIVKSKRIRRLMVGLGIEVSAPPVKYPKDYPSDIIEIIDAVKPYTMVNHERLYSLINATQYVIKNHINGAIVECGVWKGGAIGSAGLTLKALGAERHLFLYDTFEGMPAPTDKDLNLEGKKANLTFQKRKLSKDSSDWCRCQIDSVKNNMLNLGLDLNHMTFIKGKVEDTLSSHKPVTPISILRLDTDWYESTKAELEHLYPLLTKGGLLIIDDYGTWQGAREAVDEYMQKHNISMLFHRIGGGSVIGMKP